MALNHTITAGVISDLRSVYEEVMWLAKRPKVTPSVARGWYTHLVSERLKKHIRRFSGLVSAQAISDINSDLRLEHYKRIQTTLTRLVRSHLQFSINDPEEFVDTILECEKVHIVTVSENYAAMKSKGDYFKAGIDLVNWSDIRTDRRQQLWEKMLSSKVANAEEYRVK